MQILHNILADIKESKDISQLRLDDLYVCSPFTVVQLNDGSIGSAGNYDVQNHTPGYEPTRVREKYLQSATDDPLLLQTLLDDQSLVGRSIHVAVLSALSQSLLNPIRLRPFGLACNPVVILHEAIRATLEPGDVVSLIGFGGGLDTFCVSELVKHLYVCDFMFQHQEYREIAWRRIKHLGGDPSRVTLVEGNSSRAAIASSEVCFITGSALCNGTMETLLSDARQCREVTVQGPSCSLWPIEFFRRSTTQLLTTIKTLGEFEAGQLSGDDVYVFSDCGYVAISPVDGRQRISN